MDIFTTCVTLAGADLPSDRIMDGVDLSSVLFDEGPSKRKAVLYYRGTTLMAARLGPWKAHYFTQTSYRKDSQTRVTHDPPLLYHLGHDPGEQYNINEAHPEIIARIDALVAEHRQHLDPPPSQLEIPLAVTNE